MSSAKWQPMRLNVIMDILFLDPYITKTPSDGSVFIKKMVIIFYAEVRSPIPKYLFDKQWFLITIGRFHIFPNLKKW